MGRQDLGDTRHASLVQRQGMGACGICGKALEARAVRHLPCAHVFHCSCIDDFHWQKMCEEGTLDLPCFTCSAPSVRSLAIAKPSRELPRQIEQFSAQLSETEACISVAA